MVDGDARTGAVHVDADAFFVLGELSVAGGMGGQPVPERYFLIQGPGLRPLGDEVLFELLVEL
jgi:hypothetical protein